MAAEITRAETAIVIAKIALRFWLRESSGGNGGSGRGGISRSTKILLSVDLPTTPYVTRRDKVHSIGSCRTFLVYLLQEQEPLTHPQICPLRQPRRT